MAGQEQDKQACQLPPDIPSSEDSDVDQTPRPHPPPSHDHVDTTHPNLHEHQCQCQHECPCKHECEREPSQAQYHHQSDQQQFHNAPLPIHYHKQEESQHNDRFASFQAPLHAQPQCHIADSNIKVHSGMGSGDLDICYQEYNSWHPEDTGNTIGLQQHAPSDMHIQCCPLPPTQEHSDSGSHGYCQLLPQGRHPAVQAQHNYIAPQNTLDHCKASQIWEPSIEPPPKKHKIHDIDNQTPRQVLPMPRRVSNHVAGPSCSRVPPSLEAVHSDERHLKHQFDPDDYDMYNNVGYNDAAYYNY